MNVRLWIKGLLVFAIISAGTIFILYNRNPDTVESLEIHVPSVDDENCDWMITLV